MIKTYLHNSCIAKILVNKILSALGIKNFRMFVGSLFQKYLTGQCVHEDKNTACHRTDTIYLLPRKIT